MPVSHRLSILVGETELIKMRELHLLCRKVIKTEKKGRGRRMRSAELDGHGRYHWEGDISADLKETREWAVCYLREKHRQREWSLQRPWDGSMPGVLVALWGQFGWRKGRRGRRIGNEHRTVMGTRCGRLVDLVLWIEEGSTGEFGWRKAVIYLMF